MYLSLVVAQVPPKFGLAKYARGTDWDLGGLAEMYH